MAANEASPRGSAVSEGMAAARERGVRLGRPPADMPAGAARAAELRAQGQSLAGIAATLNAEAVPTPRGKGPWGKSNVQHVLSRWDQQHADGS